MGNNQSQTTAQPVPNYAEAIPFTFGPELELVLAFKDGRYKQLIDTFPGELGPDVIPLHTIKAFNARNKNFAKFLAKMIKLVSKENIKILDETDDELETMKSRGEFYDGVWQSTHDATIKAIWKNGVTEQFTVELVSPKQSSVNNSWADQLRQIWTILEENFLVLGTDGSTHCHTRLVARSAPEDHTTNIAFAAAVAKWVVFWEPCMWTLSPRSRQTSKYAKSNIAYCKYLKAELDKGGKYSRIFDLIDQLINKDSQASKDLAKIDMFKTSMERMSDKPGVNVDLVRLTLFMSENRESAWNFYNLSVPGIRSKKTSGTIEYRRPPPSSTFDQAYAHVAMSVCFVYGAVKHAKPTDDMYKRMAATDIIPPHLAPQQDPNSLVMSLPDNMQAFIDSNKAEFEQWMREAAGELQLRADDMFRVGQEIEQEQLARGQNPH
jgi:hypothetical protein